MPAPTITTCPTPGHAHPVYIELPGSDARFVVRVYASHEDAQLSRPRSITYHPTRSLALDMVAQADGPVVDLLRYPDPACVCVPVVYAHDAATGGRCSGA
jgi:hypothetical protein